MPWHVTVLVGVVAFLAAFLLADVVDYPDYLDVDGRSLVLIVQTAVAAIGAGLGLYVATRYRDDRQKAAEERQERRELAEGVRSLSAEMKANNSELRRVAIVFSEATESGTPEFPGKIGVPIFVRTVLDVMAGRIGLAGGIAPKVLRYYEVIRQLRGALSEASEGRREITDGLERKRIDQAWRLIQQILQEGEGILARLERKIAEAENR